MSGEKDLRAAAVKKRSDFPLVLGLFVLGCLALALVHAVVPTTWRSVESLDYAPQAQSLLEGRGLLDSAGRPMARYPPIFPLVYAGGLGFADRFDLAPLPVLSAVWISCASFGAVIVFAMARLFCRRLPSLFAWVMAITHPALVYATLTPLSDTLFVPLAMIALYLLLRGLFGGGAVVGGVLGACLALCTLTRPIALFLPLVFAACIVFWWPEARARRIRAALALLAVFAAFLFPWEWWVHQRGGGWIPVSTASAPALRDGLSFNHKSWRAQVELPAPVARLSDAAWAEYEHLDSAPRFAEFLAERLRADPVAVLATYAFKAGRAWYGTDSQSPRLEAAAR